MKPYDAIIVGSGLAGLVMANLLACKYKICILEKEANFFGNSGVSTLTFAACDTALQKSLYIGDSKEIFLADMLRYGEEFADKNLLKIIAKLSNKALLLLQSFGCEFKDELFVRDNHSLPRVLEPKISPLESILKPLLSRLNKKGVEIYKNAKVTDIKVENGKISGVIFDDKSALWGKNVVFATGGFCQDKHFVKAQYPLASFASSLGRKSATSQSLKILLKNGAIGVQLALMRFAFVFAIEILPYSLIIETSSSTRLCDESKDRQEIALEILKSVEKNSVKTAVIAIFDRYSISATMSEFTLKKHQDNGLIMAFDNLDELIENFNLDKETFLAEIDSYNKMFDSGVDTKFGKNILNPSLKKLKKPPFYALNLTVNLNYTQGGVKINESAQVLKIADYSSFSNLFAIGEASGGVHGKGRLVGCSSTECAVFAIKAFEQIEKNLLNL